MSRGWTIFLCIVAVGAIAFLAIYEPLTRSTREKAQLALGGRVLDFDPAGVREFRITSPSAELLIKRRGNGWRIEGDDKDRANPALIRDVLKLAASLRYTDRIDGREFRSDDDLGDYGLKKPKRKIQISGDQDVTLLIGKDAAGDGKIYVRHGSDRDVYVIDDDILKLAFQDAQNFRDPRLTDLEADQVDRVIIRRSDGQIELTQDARGWRMVKPLNAPADQASVNAYLNTLLGLSIREVLTDDSGDLSRFGIVEGTNEISFYAEGKERHQTLRIGQATQDSVIAEFTARDSVFRLPPETIKLLNVTTDALRDHRLFPLNIDLVDMIRITFPDRKIELRRGGDGWQVKAGAEMRPASEQAIRALVDAVSSAKVSEYVLTSADKLGANQLAPPRVLVEFLSVLSENTPETTAGERNIATLAFGAEQNGQILTRLNDSLEMMKVPATILSALPSDPRDWQAPR
ncbi:MAG: DUF4340 domain-containing protein [Verrucomicrobia bacterium]|nr:DUF4340 domain-containing protein [Verrucomicrobiota bacterium]